MIVETVSTGDEISSGQVVDTNAAHIARVLMENGFTLNRHSAVGDDLASLVTLMRDVGARADIAIVTGGLGPTTDDLTAAAAASAANVQLELDEAAQASMHAWFRKRGFDPTTADNKQAMLPQGALCLKNDAGTAPGFAVQINRCRFYFLPGVPHEMKRMLQELVVPDIYERQGQGRMVQEGRILSVFGIGEAALSDRLQGFDSVFPDVRLGFRAVFPTLQVKLFARGSEPAPLNRRMEDAVSWISDKLGHVIFSTEGRSLEATVGQLLASRKETVAVAESCTGGLISHLLTNEPGSSDYFLLSTVTYANQAKIGVLGVSEATLAAHGAVSEETVREMAAGVRRLSGATYGIATSGIAGPGGGTPEKPIGTLCVGISSCEATDSAIYRFSFDNRGMNKQIFAAITLETLRQKLL